MLLSIAEKIAKVFEPTLKPPPVLGAARVVEPVRRAPGGALGALHGVPELPRNFLAREAELTTLKRALLEGPNGAVGIVGIQGLGGIGKSVLATALTRDEEVRRAFPDGVYFVAFGQSPELTRLQNALAAELGVPDAGITEPFAGRDRLRELLHSKACLLILDDLWQHEHALPFEVLGPRSRSLVTTRDAQILRALGAHAHDLGVLDPESALRLLAEGSGQSASSLPPAARAVAEECGYLPLALSLAAAQVQDGVSFEDVLAAIEQGKLEFLDHPYGSVWKSLGASVRALPEAEAARYRELAVVPEDTAMPASVIASLWRARAGLEPFETNKLLVRFANKGLLYLHGQGAARTVTFHDLQLDYLRLLGAAEAPALHGALVDAVGVDLPRDDVGAPLWSALDASEQYLWQHLGHHLLEAGRIETLHVLVRDVAWLQAKLAASGASELLRELARIAECAPSEAVGRIERALRLDSGWLHQDTNALPGLLYNRLRSDGLESADIATLVPGLAPPVRLRHPVRMDGGERRVFRGHSGGVNACAYSPDGRRVLSGSDDRTLREWDASTGQELRRFEGHSGWVGACTDSPDGMRVLSAANDGTVREWDARTGLELRRFEGHSDRVSACAYSPGGTWMLSVSDDRTLREWDANTGQELRRFEGHSGWVRALTYSPDGTRVLSVSDDGTVREWDASAGQELRRFERHSGGVRAYSPDGTRVLGASSDGTLRERDARTGEELRRFEGHSRVRACAYSLGRPHFAPASADSTLKLWSTRTGRCLHTVYGVRRSLASP